jgi:ion channel-forming bestrophin family protein
MLNSRIVRGLLPPLGFVSLVSLAVCAYEELLQAGALAAWAPELAWPDVSISSQGAFSASTVALSLLLVFRTNSSYERWCATDGGARGARVAGWASVGARVGRAA